MPAHKVGAEGPSSLECADRSSGTSGESQPHRGTLATDRAVAGSEIAYLTVGLPMDSRLWEKQFPAIMRNVIDPCAKHGTKLVFFDNTSMYAGSTVPQTESTAFEPNGRKGRVRAELATMLLQAMESDRAPPRESAPSRRERRSPD